MSKSKPIKLQTPEEKLFNAARQFLTAGDILWNKHLIMPAVVYYALCFELSLKCLIQVEGNPPPLSHDLNKLFHSTSPESQKAIRRHYKELNQTEEFKQHKGIVAAQGIAVDWSFDSILKKSKNAFIDIRYYYEEPEKVFWFAGAISSLTRERILKLRPDLGK
jgi:hypothetical protein